MGCALNSDCATGLICTFGLCHSQCVKDTDCNPGMCVKSSASGDGGTLINVCQLSVESHCYYNSDCKTPLVCGRDEQCRNQCQSNVDCVAGQVCTASGVCADQSQIVAGTNDVVLLTSGRDGGFDAFVSGTAGESGAAGSSGTGGVTGAGGSAGATGAAGSAATGKGGAGGATGSGGSSGTCNPGCGPGFQCVSGSCQACGTSGSVCCGTTGTCNSNLTCVSGTCTCGAANQACCSGTTCTAGLACAAGICTCGGAGQNCCTGKTCMGSFICGGISCGCAKACDQYAAQKIDGSIYVETTPVTNIDASAFKATNFSYSNYVSCGVKADTSVWCWGGNTYGALGIGNAATTTSATPAQVMYMSSGTLTALTGITQVSVAYGGYTVCAVGAQGAVWCWGFGTSGQLGNGMVANSAYAVQVVDMTSTAVTGAKDVEVAYEHACLLKTDGSVYCWGSNNYGQIGNGTAPGTTPIPYAVSVGNLGQTATSISTSDSEYPVSCASTADGGVWCWGGNGYGELGNGMMSGTAQIPAQVDTAAATTLGSVDRIIDWPANYKTCALKSDATLWCWGSPSALYAMQLLDTGSMPVAGISVVGRGCYLDANDKVAVYGNNSTSYQVPCP
jgi:alpha-tubulin suppressor-like RCC1 family protein